MDSPQGGRPVPVQLRPGSRGAGYRTVFSPADVLCPSLFDARGLVLSHDEPSLVNQYQRGQLSPADEGCTERHDFFDALSADASR
jgi:hypothetical protein